MTISPRSVNFTALLNKLESTCRSFGGSPWIWMAASGSIVQRRFSPFSNALFAWSSLACSIDSSMGRSRISNSILPASIFEKSRMSFMRASRSFALFWAILRYLRFSFSRCGSSRWSMPIIPFIGVRISWLMVARNWLFERFASSAATRACSILSANCFCSVMSTRVLTSW